jgi:isopentenyldiphosphate isomerase
VRFDPVEIERIDYLGAEELQSMIDDTSEAFCGWFKEMIRWSLGMASDLQVLRSYSLTPLFGNHEPHQNGRLRP